MDIQEIKTAARALLFACQKAEALAFWDKNPELAEVRVAVAEEDDDLEDFDGQRELRSIEFVSESAKIEFALRMGVLTDPVEAPLVDAALKIGHWRYMIGEELSINEIARTFEAHNLGTEHGESTVYRRDDLRLSEARQMARDQVRNCINKIGVMHPLCES